MADIELDMSINGMEKVSQQLRIVEKDISSMTKTFDKMGNPLSAITTKMAESANGVKKFTKEIYQVPKGVQSIAEGLKIAGLSQKEFDTWMTKSNMTSAHSGAITNMLTGEMLSYGKAVHQAQLSVKRFRAEWLSIMFVGMALDRTFGGLVRSQMELYGISEGVSAMWTTIFAPVMDKVSDILWDIIDFFQELPEGVQEAIGWFVVIGAGIGSVLTVIGMLKTSFAPLMPMITGGLGKIGIAVKAVGAFFGGLSAGVLVAIGIVILVIVGMFLAFKENFMGMKSVVSTWIEGFKQSFNGLLTFFKGVWDIIKGIFTGNGDLVIQGFKKMFQGLWDFLVGGFKMAISTVAGVLIGAIRVMLGSLQGTINAFIAGYDYISKFFGGKGTSYRLDLVGSLSIPSFQTGGIMPHTGLAMLHKGERIVTRRDVDAEEPTFIVSPTFNINASIAQDYDVRKLATQLNSYFADEMRRLLKQRSI